MDIIITILAQLGPAADMGIPDQGITTNTFTNILNVVYFIAGAISVIVMIIGGILLMISSGDSGKAAKGRNAILYSAIGLIVVASAFMITNYVIGKTL